MGPHPWGSRVSRHQGWREPAGQQDDAQMAGDDSNSMPDQQLCGDDCDRPWGYIGLRVENQSTCRHSELSRTDGSQSRTREKFKKCENWSQFS